MQQIEFKDESETFVLRDPENYSGLYLPHGGNRGDQIQYYSDLGRRQ